MSLRLGSALRWIALPWRDAALALALIGASAAAPFLTASADLWQRSAADRIAATLIRTAGPEAAGIGVSVDAEPATNSEVLIEEVTARIAEVEGLGTVTTTVATYPGQVSSGDVTLPAPSVRLLARPGAVEALVVLELDPAVIGGVYISDWLAREAQVGPGDTISFRAAADPNDPAAEVTSGPATELVVAATYRSLWDGPLTRYWQLVPAEYVPSFLAPFNGPDVELIVMDLSTLLGSELPAVVRWDASLEAPPSTLAELEALDAGYRTLEADLAAGPISETLGKLAGAGPARPRFVSALPSTTDETVRQVGFLSQPVGTARAIGMILAGAVMASAGLLIVRRRPSEFMLLAGEGEGGLRTAARTAAQLIAPVAVGTALGTGAAVVIGGGVGAPDSTITAGTDLVPIGAVAIAGLALTSAATAASARRRLDPTGRSGPRMMVLAVSMTLVTAFLWTQVARTEPGATLDLAVVALPLSALLAAAAAGIGALRLLLRKLGRSVDRLSPVPFLTARHLAGNGAGSAVVAGALAVGIGLVAMSAHLVSSLERTIDVKLATEIGGETRLDVFGSAPFDMAPPPESTFVRFQETRVAPGDASVRVVALDPFTADRLTWPAEFGMTLDTVLDRIDTELDDGAVPVLALQGSPLAETGTFGTVEPIRYRVVGTLASAPLAAGTVPTLVAIASRIDDFEIRRIMADGPELPPNFVPPTARYRRHLVSQVGPDELAPYLAANGLQVRETITRSGRLADPDLVAPSLAFDYLGLLGWVAAAAAGSALLLHLSARRRSRALSSVMMKRMGFETARTAAATSLEVGALLSIALAAALTVTPAVGSQLIERFDPAPRIPPAVAATPLAAGIGIWMVACAGAVAVAVWLLEWRSAGRAGREVIRRAG